jgi:hypothetical protein
MASSTATPYIRPNFREQGSPLEPALVRVLTRNGFNRPGAHV